DRLSWSSPHLGKLGDHERSGAVRCCQTARPRRHEDGRAALWPSCPVLHPRPNRCDGTKLRHGRTVEGEGVVMARGRPKKRGLWAEKDRIRVKVWDARKSQA